MTTYRCDGFHGVDADSPKEAAEIFANRHARKEFGKRGYCRTVRLDCWARDGRTFHFEAFIGRDIDRQGTCQGHNVWLYIHAQRDPETGETRVPVAAYYPEG